MTPTTASGAADLLAMVSKALREAYNLGQRYWQQADSEYISQHKKADDTRAKFLALVEETCATLAAGQATAAPAEPDPTPGDHPQPCDSELFESGVSVGLFDIPKWTAEALCKGIAAATGARVDWHYIGGRVHVKALPAPTSAEGVAYAALPTSSHAGRVYEEGFLIGTCPLYNADQLRAFADATYALRASRGQAPADLSPTAGMSITQRILHVGGRNNDAGYVEFGSIQAVDALVRQFLRDLPAPATADSVLEDAAREAIEKVLALFPFNVPSQKFTVNNGPCLTADNDDEFYSVKRVLAFLTEIKTTLDAARKQGEKQ